jgi:hypothetical protein
MAQLPEIEFRFIDFSSHSLDPTPLDIVGQTSGSHPGWPILHGQARAEMPNREQNSPQIKNGDARIYDWLRLRLGIFLWSLPARSTPC